MPGAFADFSETDGMLSVSSVYIQGGAILEVVVNDPGVSATDVKISNGPTVLIGGDTYITNQATNGKWYVYAVDNSISTDLDNNADGTTGEGDGFEYGVKCVSGIGVHKGHGAEAGNSAGTRGTANIIGDESYDVWAEAVISDATTAAQAGGCLGLNNMKGSLDDTAGTTSRQLMSAAVLQDAPSLSDWKGGVLNATVIDLGQRGHGLNESGYGSWPYILAFEFDSDNLVEYGSDSVNVEFGNTNDETSISLLNQSPADEVHLYLSITDPALNIDPTTADKWVFDIHAADDQDHHLVFANNHTDTNGGNTAISLAEQGSMGFSGNGRLANSTDSASTYISGGNQVMMTETESNSATFESWAVNGTSQLVTVDEVAGDKKSCFHIWWRQC
jgi:hypothetical protein